jgi:hypothetical protein
MTQDLFDHLPLINRRKHSQPVLAMRTNRRVSVPDFENDVPPLLGRQLRRWRRLASKRAPGCGGLVSANSRQLTEVAAGVSAEVVAQWGYDIKCPMLALRPRLRERSVRFAYGPHSERPGSPPETAQGYPLGRAGKGHAEQGTKDGEFKTLI